VRYRHDVEGVGEVVVRYRVVQFGDALKKCLEFRDGFVGPRIILADNIEQVQLGVGLVAEIVSCY
jgi:hypothetical protein